MSRAERALRRQDILDLAIEGTAPADIARKFGVTANTVRQVLRAAGIEENNRPDRPDSIWGLSDDERRIEFAIRASRGAKERLDQIENEHRDWEAASLGLADTPRREA